MLSHSSIVQRSIFGSLAILLALAGGAGATVLDWPLGDVVSGQRVPGYGIYVQQNYANRGGAGWYGNRPHAGVDLRYTNRNNAGAPVFAAADGIVRYAAYTNYPAWVVVIEHTEPDGDKVYTQYGHIENVAVASGDYVSKGTQVGTIWDWGTNSHLHFEVRSFLYDPINGTIPGPGYGSVNLEPWQQGWLDPVEYHYEHHGAMPSSAELTADRNLRATPSLSGTLVTTLPAGQVVVEDIVEDLSGNGDWWYKVRYNDNGSTGYVNAFWKEGWDSYVYFGDAAKLGSLIFPGVINNSGWDTNFYVRNLRSGTNRVYLSVYHPNGTLAYSDARDLANNGSWKVSFANTVAAGTAVLTADYDTDLVAVARLERKNSDGDYAYASYEGIELPQAYQFVPVVHHDNWSWFNRIFFYNPDTHGAVSAVLSFSGASACNRTLSIGPGRTVELNTYHETCAPDGWYGRVTVTSSYATNGESAPIAVMSLQESRVGDTRKSMAAAAISLPTAKKLFVPLIQNNNYGYLAGIGADKGAGTGGLSLSYYEPSGATCLTDPTFTSWPVIHNPLPGTPNSCQAVLSATATGTSSADKIYAQINQLSGYDATSHPAVPHPAKKVHLPFLEEGTGLLRGIQIQNTTVFSTYVTVLFYDHAGTLVGQRGATVLGRGSWTLTGNHASGLIPPAARNAEISASRNLAVEVNNLLPGGGRDKLMDYTASGRP